MKSLSVVIPSYNASLYLARCVDSLLLDSETISALDIIIVNDGSSDNTLEIAKRYQKQFKGTIQVIDKPNGGHGSTINAGLAAARGKYIKILDSDDWFNVFDLPRFIQLLSSEKADVVVTNYRREIIYDNRSYSFIFSTSDEHPILNISDAIPEINQENFFFKFSMPAMAIKTATLRRVWGEGLLEKTFYVDQQFVAKVLECAETYTIYNLDIYRHFIGRPDQSISSLGFYKHRKDHERVLKNLLSTYSKMPESPAKKILNKQIALMITTHYNIYLSSSLFSKSDAKEILSFDKYLATHHQEFARPDKQLSRKIHSPRFILNNLIKGKA